ANEKADEVPLSPSARQLVADHGVDPTQIAGSGRGGRIIKEDVLAHLEKQGKPATPPAPTPATVEPAPAPPPTRTGPAVRATRQRMTTIRQRIAERLLAAQQNAAILTTFNECDLSQVMALRAKYKEPFQKRHGVGLGFMSFFVKASVEALKAFPLANARIDGS